MREIEEKMALYEMNSNAVESREVIDYSVLI